MDNRNWNQIDFNHIKGKNNVLADTLSRLINVDLEVKLNPDLTNYKLGQYCLEQLLKARRKVDQKLRKSEVIGENIEINEIHLVYDE